MKAEPLTLTGPRRRPDRLVAISGRRARDLKLEYSIDAGATWCPATVYVGETAADWIVAGHQTWNRGAIEGRIPRGSVSCVWNRFFDLSEPVTSARVRLMAAGTGERVWARTISLSSDAGVPVVNAGNLVSLAGGGMPAPWKLEALEVKRGSAASLVARLTRKQRSGGQYPVYDIDEAFAPPLVLRPDLQGWYRVYAGTDQCTSFQFSLSREGVLYPVPDYLGHRDNAEERRLTEYCLGSFDMTGQEVNLWLGGARYWRDVALRYIRFVPMTQTEVRQRRRARDLARTRGRSFAAYVEPCTPVHYEPESLTLRGHVRNDMRLHRSRGCDQAYVHVIRLGSRAWYHSDVVERYAPRLAKVRKWSAWMKQGDPLQVAIEEAREVGLKILPDMGMNIAYDTDALRERTIRRHRDWLFEDTKFLDYRIEPVREYAARVADELVAKYDVDGIHLDFARFAHNRAFDVDGLVDVVQRIHTSRRAAEDRWGHPVVLAVRIPSDRYGSLTEAACYQGSYDEFLAALLVWAQHGWIDRVAACTMGYLKDVRRTSLRRYSHALGGTQVELWGDIYCGGAFEDTAPEAWIDVARRWVGQGLNGGFFAYSRACLTEFEQLKWQLRLVDFPDVRVEP